jgi:N-acetylglucosaminyldiphosphoundecaprenol N-acetyl-beta-D-mannosaminyltransferase
MIMGASLVLPISLSLAKGARFLHRDEPVRYTPFDFIVRLLSALERRGRSAYMLGSTRSVIQKAEANVKATFPGLRVVGRYAGRYPKPMESSIIEAVRKATPSLLLVGAGVPGRERWIPRNLARFNSGIYLWCSDLFEVLASRRRRASSALSRRGLEWIPYMVRKPWKAYRAFIYLWYCLLLLAARLRGSR